MMHDNRLCTSNKKLIKMKVIFFFFQFQQFHKKIFNIFSTKLYPIFLHSNYRATLDKGPKTNSPRTNLKQIEPWIGPFFTFKKHFFYSTMSMSVFKGLGPIWRYNIKIVWLAFERIMLTFGFFLFFIVYFYFYFFVKKIILTTHNGWA